MAQRAAEAVHYSCTTSGNVLRGGLAARLIGSVRRAACVLQDAVLHDVYARGGQHELVRQRAVAWGGASRVVLNQLCL